MKLQKSEYNEGTLKSRSKHEIQSFLTNKIAALIKVNVEEIDSNKTFSQFGIDSVQAVELSAELEDYLGNCSIEPTLLWNYPNIDAVSVHLSSEVHEDRDNIQPHTSKDLDREPIAIVGMGCRFPGSPNLNEYWRLLIDGKDAVTEVPPDRWNIDRYYDADVKMPGKMNTRWGGFLDSVGHFDAEFFGISPREASKMDPQQRLLLEVSWEALQDAGQVTEQWSGQKIGVFIGITQSDYADMLLSDPNLSDAYFGTGNALSIAANRLSYFYGFRGPSMSIDTACSSSLVSVYQACKSIWEQECEAALAGGVNLILSPSVSVQFSKTGFLSPEGKCKTFDADANGYTRGEGVGIVVLKPLSKALADGDRIYSIIRGGAINNDGRTNGLMAPSSEAQLLLLQEAYLRAGISPKDVQYIEAHGTGTVLGDPIEVKALSKLLAIQHEIGQSCAIGSVKSNIGHLEGAAGIAGLIKVSLMLKNQWLPASLHIKHLNPYIPFDKIPVHAQITSEPWHSETPLRIAGVSSFGFGGTNCHLVLEEASQASLSNKGDNVLPDEHLLLLSAKSENSLRKVVENHLNFFKEHEGIHLLKDICYTASVRKDHLDYRIALRVSNDKNMIREMELLLGEHMNATNNIQKEKGGIHTTFILSDYSYSTESIYSLYQKKEPWIAEAIQLLEPLFKEYGTSTAFDRMGHLLLNGESSPIEENLLRFVCMYGVVMKLKELCVTPDYFLYDGELSRIVIGTLYEGMGLADSVQLALHHIHMEPSHVKTDNWTLKNMEGELLEVSNHTTETIHNYMNDNCKLFIHLTNELADVFHHDRRAFTIQLIEKGSSLRSKMLELARQLFNLGFDLNWKAMYPTGQLIPLPNYPWDHKRYWIESSDTSKDNELSEQYNDESNNLTKYYHSLAKDRKPLNEYLSFAPFMTIKSGFSWIKTLANPDRHPELYQETLDAQAQMREVMFRLVDFARINNVVEIGCGYASDLIRLGQAHPNLQLHGINISTEQIEIARVRIRELELDSKIQLFKRDLSKESLPGNYDMALGIQIMHHIEDKASAFSHLGNKLKDGGIVILAEIISNTMETIKHEPSSAYFVSKQAWAEILAEQQLMIINCVDASREIGNFLFDPDFYSNLEGLDQNRNDIVKEHMEGPHLLGELLRRGVATYGLITAQKCPSFNNEMLKKYNLNQLQEPTPYAEIIDDGTMRSEKTLIELHTVATKAQQQLQKFNHVSQFEAYLIQQIAEVLEQEPSHLRVSKSLHSMGMDSIMAIDIKQRVEKELGLQIPIAELMKGPSIKELSFRLQEVAATMESGSKSNVLDMEKRAKGMENPQQLMDMTEKMSELQLNQMIRLYQEMRVESNE